MQAFSVWTSSIVRSARFVVYGGQTSSTARLSQPIPLALNKKGNRRRRVNREDLKLTCSGANSLGSQGGLSGVLKTPYWVRTSAWHLQPPDTSRDLCFHLQLITGQSHPCFACCRQRCTSPQCSLLACPPDLACHATHRLGSLLAPPTARPSWGIRAAEDPHGLDS